MGRPNWYSDHPAACQCATCTEERISPSSKYKKVLLEMPSREKFVRWSVYGIIILVVFLLLISFML